MAHHRPHRTPAWRRFSALTLCAAILAGSGLPARQPARVVAIGDIHGSLESFVAILQRAGLAGADRHWTGGATTLVQTGDYTDRGEHVRAVMDLLMALEREAKAGGGQVITLLGNHEVMNLVGETRDVTEAILATFADADSEARRETAWREYEALAKSQIAASPDAPGVYRQARDAWMAAHPPGFLEYRQAFAPQGHYGRWLRSKDVAARLERTIFMHAGVNPETTEMTHDEVNRQVRTELKRYDAYVRELVDRKLALPFFSLQEILEATAFQLRMATAFVAAEREGRKAPTPGLDRHWLLEGASVLEIGTWALLAPDGPLWFRGYATWPDTAGDLVTKVLQRFRADRLVVGHTVQPAGIAIRFDSRVFLIDTGMLVSVYKGRPAALELAGDRVTALYVDR